MYKLKVAYNAHMTAMYIEKTGVFLYKINSVFAATVDQTAQNRHH
jgi:hypothetical protein